MAHQTHSGRRYDGFEPCAEDTRPYRGGFGAHEHGVEACLRHARRLVGSQNHMTRDTCSNGGRGQNPTASRESRIVRTITGPSERATAIVEDDLDTEQEQALAIFATHGLADVSSTMFATAALGPGAESNPIVGHLLAQGWGLAVGAMLLVVGMVSVAYPRLARVGGFPNWFGIGLALVGAAVASINLVVGVMA